MQLYLNGQHYGTEKVVVGNGESREMQGSFTFSHLYFRLPLKVQLVTETNGTNYEVHFWLKEEKLVPVVAEE